MKPSFYPTPEAFRTWLGANHARATEHWVGFYKRSTGRPSITWPESVDEALCFGWIDGVRRSVDTESYMIRFTPRRSGSTWSAVNIRRVEALLASGRMQPAGRRAFEARRPERSGTYSYERAHATLDADHERRFRSNKAAWSFFQAQPPGYRRLTIHWVVSAKRKETRLRRLDQLIRDSAAGRRIAALARPSRKPIQ